MTIGETASGAMQEIGGTISTPVIIPLLVLEEGACEESLIVASLQSKGSKAEEIILPCPSSGAEAAKRAFFLHRGLATRNIDLLIETLDLDVTAQSQREEVEAASKVFTVLDLYLIAVGSGILSGEDWLLDYIFMVFQIADTLVKHPSAEWLIRDFSSGTASAALETAISLCGKQLSRTLSDNIGNVLTVVWRNSWTDRFSLFRASLEQPLDVLRASLQASGPRTIKAGSGSSG